MIVLTRYFFAEDVTLGKLYLDGELFCETLELTHYMNRPRTDCIPTGVYPLEVTYSPKFKRETVELMNVPERLFIRIHSGNTKKDSSGCIIVAKNVDTDKRMVWGDSLEIEKKITEYVKQKHCVMQIVNSNNLKMVFEEVKV
jgi:hypothetical protein